MEKIKFENINGIKFTELLDLKQCIVGAAHKAVKYYIADVCICFENLEWLNRNGGIPEKMILLFRESGVEIEEIGSKRIISWSNYDEKKYCQDYRWFIIDFKRYKEIISREHNIPHYDYLISTNCYDQDELMNNCCIFEKTVQEIREINKEEDE